MSEVDQPDGEHVTLVSNGHRWQLPHAPYDRYDTWHCDNCGLTISPSDPATPCQGHP